MSNVRDADRNLVTKAESVLSKKNYLYTMSLLPCKYKLSPLDTSSPLYTIIT